jgi:ABC-type hemin transport system ATPase subunit
MIEVENLTKYYGNLAAIKDVTFQVDEGEILSFLGPNAPGGLTTPHVPRIAGGGRVPRRWFPMPDRPFSSCPAQGLQRMACTFRRGLLQRR